MAHKKETPRQKMIGMMYLVLMALLALNVSKEVVAAFVTINDKIDASNEIISLKSDETYHQFEQKKVGLIATQSSLKEFDIWHSKALDVEKMTDELVNYIMSESNAMIATAEGEDWVASRKSNGHIEKLKPLIDIKNMDNYDIPTNIFVGTNPTTPNERGVALQSRINAYRDSVCMLMGNISYGGRTYSFSPPSNPEELDEALQTTLPEDRHTIKQVYQSLTIPAALKSYSQDKDFLPWASVMFDHAPIVAAASLLNALKLDVKNSEAEVANFFLRKVEAPAFIFNKIQPLPFASSRYINSGDSLLLNVMIAAYDSTAKTVIRYGIDADTLETNWQETTGAIRIKGSVGHHKIKGAIGVEERGQIKWKPWSYMYSVNKPLGVISQPEMRVLYRGYDNIIEATASGYPSESIQLSGSGCRISRSSGQKYKVTVNRGVRTASINMYAIKEDGSRENLGSYDYKIKPLPRAVVFLGNIKTGDTPSHGTTKSQRITSIRFPNDVLLRQVPLHIVSGKVTADGVMKKGKVKPGGRLDSDAISVLKMAKGKTIRIRLKYKDPSGRVEYAEPLIFTSRP